MPVLEHALLPVCAGAEAAFEAAMREDSGGRSANGVIGSLCANRPHRANVA
jgi:hypothetical protein